MNAEYSNAWFKKASKDYKSALELFKSKDEDFYENIAFLCQQCAEKYLKGFLAFHNKKIEKTHALAKILIQCNKIEDFSSIRHIINLSIFAVEFRYPGDNFILSEEKVAGYIRNAKNVIDIVDSLLSEDRLL